MTSKFGVAGKTALVTGASSGIGRHVATLLAQSGARVVGVARRLDALDEWQKSVGEIASAVAADITDHASLPATLAAISAPFGPPDIVVHAAGLNLRQTADEVTPEGWDRTLAVNLSAPFFLSQALVPEMKKKNWGRIVNFASLQTFRAFPGGVAYGATKGGIGQLTRAMAEAWSRHGILANAIAPGVLSNRADRAGVRRSRTRGSQR